jgi:hypothetical protein
MCHVSHEAKFKEVTLFGRDSGEELAPINRQMPN